MKELKLFPKTFLYVFSLMAAISLISHALFYFMMPIVYTSQKEAKFLDTQERLIEILKNTPPDKMERTVSRYAIQYQMGIFVNCDGAAYNLRPRATAHYRKLWNRIGAFQAIVRTQTFPICRRISTSKQTRSFTPAPTLRQPMENHAIWFC